MRAKTETIDRVEFEQMEDGSIRIEFPNWKGSRGFSLSDSKRVIQFFRECELPACERCGRPYVD